MGGGGGGGGGRGVTPMLKKTAETKLAYGTEVQNVDANMVSLQTAVVRGL